MQGYYNPSPEVCHVNQCLSELIIAAILARICRSRGNVNAKEKDLWPEELMDREDADFDMISEKEAETSKHAEEKSLNC